MNGELGPTPPPTEIKTENLNGSKPVTDPNTGPKLTTDPTVSKLITDPNDPDPVIHEIPVFLAKNLASKLFMFQVKINFTRLTVLLSFVL